MVGSVGNFDDTTPGRDSTTDFYIFVTTGEEGLGGHSQLWLLDGIQGDRTGRGQGQKGD